MNNENNVPIALTDKPERTLDMVAAEIRTFTAGMLNNVIEIGRRMVEAKAMLPYGQFGAWIKDNTDYSVSTANNFMNLYLEYGSMQGSLFGAETESQTFGKLTYSKALALLAIPAEEREAFAEDVDAESISVRELRREIDGYKRKQEATQAALDAERDKAAQLKRELDGKATHDEIRWAEVRAEERRKAEAALEIQITAANDSAENARKDIEKYRAALEKARAAKDKAESGVAEAVRKAKENAVAQMQAQLDEANAALDEANAAAQKASEEESKLRQELSEARKAASESKAAPVEDKAIAEFSFLFNQAKDTANHMRNIILTVRKTDAETAEKLSGIMRKLAEEMRRCAE